MNEPTIVASLVTALAMITIALGSVFYRFGRLSGQMDAMRHENTRRHAEMTKQAKERYDGIIDRLSRLENHFIRRSSNG